MTDAEENEVARKVSFQALGINQRIDAIQKATAAVMTHLGFTLSKGMYLRATNGTLSVAHFSFYTNPGEKLSFPSLDAHIPYGSPAQPEYDLNFKDSINRLTNLRQRSIVCCFSKISFLEVCHQLSSCTPIPERQLLAAADSSAEIPILEPAHVGEVYYDYKLVRKEHLTSYIWDLVQLNDGSDLRYSFAMRSVPAGISSIDSDTKGLRFVSEGLKRRRIPRQIEYQLFDQIESDTAFTRRLEAVLTGFA